MAEELVRGLGFLALTASVFNCTVGGGIFRLPASVYALVGGASPLVYLICFVVISLVALVFIQVGRTIKTSGGPYAYVQPVLGPYLGYLCGVLLWALAVFAMASIANAYANFVGILWPALGSTPLQKSISLAVTFLLLAVMNTRGVKQGARLSIVLSVIKILPLLILIFVGLPSLNTQALALPSPLPLDGLARASLLLIFAFTGIETALIPSGEIQNPEKNLARALFGGLSLVLFLYLGVQFVSESTLGAELGTPGGFPLALAAERLLGPNGRLLIEMGAIFSTLGYLSALTLSLPRSLYAFAKDGYLPKGLAKINPRFHTPDVAIFVQMTITWILAVSNEFEKLAVLANLSAILMYIVCAFASIQLGRKQKYSWRYHFIPVLAIAAMGYLLTSVTLIEWASVAVLLFLASVLFWQKNNKEPRIA